MMCWQFKEKHPPPKVTYPRARAYRRLTSPSSRQCQGRGKYLHTMRLVTEGMKERPLWDRGFFLMWENTKLSGREIGNN